MADIIAIATEQFTPIVEAAGYILEEVTLTSIAGEKFLSVIVDHDVSINLDEVTVISKAISALIDESSEFGDAAFTLEVTTPGIDRPLTTMRHWKKNLNRLVKVTKSDGTSVEGRLIALNNDGIELSENIKGRIKKHTLSFDDIKKAIVQVEFKHFEGANASENESLTVEDSEGDEEFATEEEFYGDEDGEE
jgi:ribosome maturation factor RimP